MDMYGFNPYMVGVNPQMQQMQYMQQQQMQQQRPQQMPQAMPSVMYTPTAKDFANVTLQPPTRQAIIIAQNEPYMCFKNADNMGMVSTTFYKIEPVTEEQISTPVEYATKQEVANLENAVNQIINALKGGQNDDKSTNASDGTKQPVVANYATAQAGQPRTNSNANNADKSTI